MDYIDIILIIIIVVSFILNITEGSYIIKNWDVENVDKTYKVFSLLFIVITIIIIVTYSLIRITRWGDTAKQLWDNKNYGIFIWLIPIIFSIIYSIATLAYVTEKGDKKEEDKKEDEKKKEIDKKKADIIIGSFSIVGFVILIGVILALLYYYGFGEIGRGILYAGIFLSIIVIIVVIGFISKDVDEKKDIEKNPEYDAKYPPPTDRIKTLEELERILKNLGDFKMDNECKVDNQNDCNYLYKQYIASGGDDEILNKILDALMKGKNDDAKINLINQAIFLIYQLLQCKIRLEYKMSIYKFGTWDWWKTHIYMWGKKMKEGGPSMFWESTDPIQRYIYLIALLICILFFFYNFGNYVTNSYKIFGTPIKAIMGIMTIVFWFIYLLWSYGDVAGSAREEKDLPVEKELQKYEEKEDKKTKSQTGSRMLYSFFTILVISIIVSYVATDTFVGNFNKVNALAMVIALILSFNAYYMALIPQLVIIGLILQKYILSTNIFTDVVASIIKGVIIVAVLFASFYDTTYGKEDIKDELKKYEKADRYEGILSAYNKPIWYIYGILMALLIQNAFESFMGATTDYDPNRWSLLLTPIARYFMEFISKGSITYKEISVRNDFL